MVEPEQISLESELIDNLISNDSIAAAIKKGAMHGGIQAVRWIPANRIDNRIDYGMDHTDTTDTPATPDTYHFEVGFMGMRPCRNSNRIQLSVEPKAKGRC